MWPNSPGANWGDVSARQEDRLMPGVKLWALRVVGSEFFAARLAPSPTVTNRQATSVCADVLVLG